MDIYTLGKLDILVYSEKDLDIGYFNYTKYPFSILDTEYLWIYKYIFLMARRQIQSNLQCSGDWASLPTTVPENEKNNWQLKAY